MLTLWPPEGHLNFPWVRNPRDRTSLATPWVSCKSVEPAHERDFWPSARYVERIGATPTARTRAGATQSAPDIPRSRYDDEPEAACSRPRCGGDRSDPYGRGCRGDRGGDGNKDRRDRERNARDVALVDARQLAEDLGVSLDYVYAHATELGAMRLGPGPKARIRFDLDRARGALEARTGRSNGKRRR